MATRSFRDAGFAVAELMTVVLILGILVSVAVPVFSGATARAQAATCFANQMVCERAAELYRSQESTSPATLADMVSKRLLTALPQCPSKGTYVWRSRTNGANDTLACSLHYVSTTVPPLFTTAWADLTGFKTLMGKWTVSGGLIRPSTSTYQNRGLFGGPAWTDVRISTTATLKKGAGYGIYFRATDSAGGPTGYCFQYDPGQGNRFAVRKVVNGKESGPIAQAKMPDNFAVYNKSHAVEITAIGNRIVAKVDGSVVLDFVDSSFTSGQAGLRSWDRSDVSIGAVNVYKATP